MKSRHKRLVAIGDPVNTAAVGARQGLRAEVPMRAKKLAEKVATSDAAGVLR